MPQSQPARQFHITSFLPRAFAPPSQPPPPRPKHSKRKHTSSDDEEIEILDDDADDADVPDSVPVSSRPNTDTPVIDLTLDDDDDDDHVMPPPPVPSATKRTQCSKKKPSSNTKTSPSDAVPKSRLDKGKQVELVPDPSSSTASDRMWIDDHTPTSREDLAVHAKKVTDVANWFEEAFPPSSGGAAPNKLAQKYRRVLVLSGPAGSGKTACLTTLARERGVQVLEWTEDANVSNANDEYRESMVARFTSFLARAGMTPSLDFVDSSDPSSSSSLPDPFPSYSETPRRLILLEDLPNVSHYPTKLALRSALQQYLTSPRVTCPLVVIVSEALARPGASDGSVEAGAGGTGWSRNTDSLDSRSVCGVQVLQHPACREISFNPIAPTIMKKALNRILDTVYDSAISSSRSKAVKMTSTTASSSSSSSSSSNSTTLDPTSRPNGATLDLILQHSNGDLRSALMSLQFLTTRTSDSTRTTSLGGTGKAKPKRPKTHHARGSRRPPPPGPTDPKGLLQFVTSRENSLFIFHALGKVLYNKRWGESVTDDKKDLNRPGILQDPTTTSTRSSSSSSAVPMDRDEYAMEKLPKHLRKEWKRNPSKVDPDVVYSEAPIDSDVFLVYLHHNFAQFTSDSIEACANVLDSLSDADVLSRAGGGGDGGGWNRTSTTGLASLYSFGVAVRGTLLGLPSPVERNKQVLRKSEWWEVDRIARENEASVGELVITASDVDVDDSGGGGVGLESCWRRDKKSLMTELIPWFSLVKPTNINPFLLDLATFPPLEARQGATSSLSSSSSALNLSGEAIGEKDIKLEDDDDDEEEERNCGNDEDDEARSTFENATAAAERGVTKKLEEVEPEDDDEGTEGPSLTARRAAKQAGTDGWYETEDDIVDDDDDVG